MQDVPVALFTRAWIEIKNRTQPLNTQAVALFTRAWIEILMRRKLQVRLKVALFTRAWIEIQFYSTKTVSK